ncbi:MAG TPA: DUF6636 domain-containing protein [Solirubrobacteraceae bacterium]|jgi:hypothetical protein
MRKLALIALMTATLLAGCGGGTTTVTVKGPPTAAPTALTSTHASSKAAPGKTQPKKENAFPTATQIIHESAFQTPSGNIGCQLIDGLARCDIEKRSWSPPPRPASCPNVVDFGQGLEVSAEGTAAGFVCAGDTARDPSSPKLAYGTGTQVGDFLCVSEEDGLSCRDTESGHGFFISIQSYRTF